MRMNAGMPRSFAAAGTVKVEASMDAVLNWLLTGAMVRRDRMGPDGPNETVMESVMPKLHGGVGLQLLAPRVSLEVQSR